MKIRHWMKRWVRWGLTSNNAEEDSSTHLSKCEKSNEEQDALLVDGKEVSKFLWVVSSEVES